jgi:hypothetical protein
MGSRCASGGAGEQDTGLVVPRISISASGAFDVFDVGVGSFGAGVGDALLDEHFDLGPPGSTVCQSRQLSSMSGGEHITAQDHLLVPGSFQISTGEEPSELFFDPPRG